MKQLLSALVVTGMILGCQSGASTSKPKTPTPPANGKAGEEKAKGGDDKAKAGEEKAKAGEDKGGKAAPDAK